MYLINISLGSLASSSVFQINFIRALCLHHAFVSPFFLPYTSSFKYQKKRNDSGKFFRIERLKMHEDSDDILAMGIKCLFKVIYITLLG